GLSDDLPFTRVFSHSLDLGRSRTAIHRSGRRLDRWYLYGFWNCLRRALSLFLAFTVFVPLGLVSEPALGRSYTDHERSAASPKERELGVRGPYPRNADGGLYRYTIGSVNGGRISTWLGSLFPFSSGRQNFARGRLHY